MKDIDYYARYELFRKFPFYIFVATIVFGFVFGVIDYGFWLTELADEGLSFVVWPLIGVVCGLINWFVSSIVISPVIVIADSMLERALHAEK